MDYRGLVSSIQLIHKQVLDSGAYKPIRTMLFQKHLQANVYLPEDTEFFGCYIFLDSKLEGTLDSYRLVCVKKDTINNNLSIQIDHMFLDVEPEIGVSMPEVLDQVPRLIEVSIIPYIKRSRIQTQCPPSLEKFMN